MEKEIAKAQMELDLQPQAQTFPTTYIVLLSWKTTAAQFEADVTRHFSRYISKVNQLAPKDGTPRVAITVLEDKEGDEKTRMKAIRYAFAPFIGNVTEVIPPSVPTLSEKIGAKIGEVRDALKAVDNDSPVANTIRISRGKDPLPTATLRAIESLRNLQQSLAMSANDLASVPAYRAFAEKQGLFTVTHSVNDELPKPKWHLALEKQGGFEMDVLGSKLTRVSVIDPLRAEIGGIVAQLDNGRSLESQKDRIDAVNKASGEIFANMRAVYAVNAPKDPAAGVEEKVDAAIERIRKAVGDFFVNTGTRLMAAFERATTRKTPDATVAPEAPKPVTLDPAEPIVMKTLTGEEAQAARAAHYNDLRSRRR